MTRERIRHFSSKNLDWARRNEPLRRSAQAYRMALLNADITEAFDSVETLLLHPASRGRVRDELTTAKDALFRARLLTDPEEAEEQ